MEITTIKVSLVAPGIHHWPDAPDSHKFLRSPHHHHFKITAVLKVAHDDRDLEFFAVQSHLQFAVMSRYAWNSHSGYDYTTHSCEQIAKNLIHFDPSVVAITVAEDDMFEATVYKEP
jgi:hypothetical protein